MKNSTVGIIIGSTLVIAIAWVLWVFSQPTYGYHPSLANDAHYWAAPDTMLLPANDSGALIHYGRELIAHTALYLGPRGSVAHITNGMNCQNCHLGAGTKMWGNNFSAVRSCYPKFRERSGGMENIIKRVQDCLVRSLAGKPLDSNGHEMKAIVAYINWLGSGVKKNIKPEGAGIHVLAYINRATDTNNGREVYIAKCQSCHQPDGQGVLAANGLEYTYPPLWGAHSYNTGAGMYRLERLAGFAKDNMPFGVSYTGPQLSDEEAWDVAAYVNSRARGVFNIAMDYPDKAGKPIDYPFGPYTDTFSEQQHKYGPYTPIKQWRENHKKKS